MENFSDTHSKKLGSFSYLAVAAGILVFLGIAYYLFAAPVSSASSTETFVVPIGENRKRTAEKLGEKGFIKSTLVFNLAFMFGTISPGGYKISKDKNVFQIASILKRDPYMKWVTIKEGLRKEEIGEILARNLEWDEEDLNWWHSINSDEKNNYKEGVYFPDTYLIPRDETPEEVSTRMVRRFEEKFKDFSEEAERQNIRWPTVIKIASLVQREAAGSHDMALISGVIWNRLLSGMKLDIDATLQYMKGGADTVWWPKITAEDKKINSPYNTYMYNGLPPTPIANPGTSAIKSVLFPEETECFYYLHDNNRKIHCAKTYQEHKVNIEKYLR